MMLKNEEEKKVEEKITHEFQVEYTFDERVKESKNIREKYPDRIPIILERALNSQT